MPDQHQTIQDPAFNDSDICVPDQSHTTPSSETGVNSLVLAKESDYKALPLSDLAAALQALLFVSPEPVSVLKLATACSASVHEVTIALSELQEHLAMTQSGLVVRERAGKWSLATDSRLHDLLKDYLRTWDTRRLSAAALETMAIVAYLQPITRAQLAEIRGVNSDSPLNSLIEKNLVKEAGCLDTPGNPSLYVTTKIFLEKFGLRSLRDLDPLELFAPTEEVAQAIAERLGGMREDIAQAREAFLARESQAQDQADHEDYGPDDPDKIDESAAVKDGAENSTPTNTQATSLDTAAPDKTLNPAISNSLAASFGLSEKIDFTELIFDEDED